MTYHDVAAAVIRHRGRVLLCHRNPSRDWYPNCWDIVGGHIEHEESAEQAITRECREELGITVREAQPTIIELDDPAITVHAFVIDSWDGEITNNAPAEHDAIAWFAPGDLHALDLADGRYLAWLTGLLS